MTAVERPPLGLATNRRATLGTLILATSAFLIVTTEFLMVGLLPRLARDLDVSISSAGQLITLFAFTVMLAGPPLTAALAHLDRRKLFAAILALFAAANALAAIAPNIWVLAVARFLPALALPVFWGTASETAARMVSADRQGQAVAQVYLGISAALLLGIPLGTLAANAIGWRGAFWVLAAASALMAFAVLAWMPAVARQPKVDFSQQARIFREPIFLANVALSVLVFTAMFIAYTYLADMLERTAGVATADVGWWLMGFGAIGLLGNWLGGRAVRQSPIKATALFLALLGVGMAAFSPLASAPITLWAALALWGIANTALYPICQVRVMNAVSHSQALAGTTNVSAANAGIGLGALLGGLVIPAFGVSSLGYVAAGVALLAMLCVPGVARLQARAEHMAVQPG
ncbi:MFS transporter [Pseudomonas sp. SWRI59]|uniref:MFS transporter n=1 Tax=unclassified Pseudomonas TaxID=196821 RepID=UPI0016470B67|nr:MULTISPECIES: MFS transporter [unclassified Pseudomonas]MBC3502544.1 MFS transporter [Pseudomonas sp. SWRI59]MBC3508361.1 MFS transporter [Pseudomonas sp. SWRI68]